MKAIVQGEFHVSKTDQQSLSKLLDEDIDAVFLESRTDSFAPGEWSLGYAAFLVSAILFFWLQNIADRGDEHQPEYNVPVFDQIDTPLPELYPRFPTSWVLFSGFITALFIGTGIFWSQVPFPFFTAPPLIDTLYTISVKIFLVIFSPILFSAILIYLEERLLGSRDRDMAQAITSTANTHGFETIVVSCGEMHLGRLPRLLEQEGWEVEDRSSSHWWASWLWRV